MGKNTSFLIGDHLENFVREEVSSGRYSSASEVVRSALRLLEREEKTKTELIKALEVGEESGWIKDFDPEETLREINEQDNPPEEA